ncbi:MAG: GDYXXLXY domain-containing protein [Alphaproteobacteria bacterium]
MRNIVFIAASLVILCAFNWSIFEKETLRQDGETVLLELAPVDPRSLMQGDYMRLNYQVTTDMGQRFPKAAKRGYVVISVNTDSTGSVARLDDGSPLRESEMLLRYHQEYSRFRIVPDSFLFQEGLRMVYQPAKYGVFKFDKSGNHMLVGLAGADRKLIEPPEDRIPSLQH